MWTISTGGNSVNDAEPPKQIKHIPMNEIEEGFGIRKNLVKFLRNWPIFLISLILTLTAAFLFIKLVPKKYQTTAAILIKDQKKGTEDAQMVQSLNQLASNKIVENEIEVLKSKELILSVIDKLKLYATVDATENFVRREVYELSPIDIEVRHPDSIQKCKPIPVQFAADGKSFTIHNKSYQTGEWVNTDCGVFRITAIHAEKIDRNKDYRIILQHPKLVAENLSKELAIYTANKMASVINLSLYDANAKKAEDILNTLLKEYNAIAFKEKNQLASNTLSVVNERLSVAAKDLDSIEHSLQTYKSQTGSMDVSAQSKLLLENITQNDQKAADIQRKLRSLRELQRNLNTPGNQLLQAPSVNDVDDKLLADLIQQLYEQEIKYNSLSKTTAMNSPIMIAIQDRIEKLRPVITNNINNQIRSLEQAEQTLLSTNSKYSAHLSSMPVREREIIEISREQNKKVDLYNYLLQKREEAELSISAAVPDNRIIDRATSTVKPVKPKTIIVLGGAFVAGLLIASMIVLTKDALKITIDEPAQLEQLTGKPVLTEIVEEKKSGPLVAVTGARTEIAEQFRRLRSSLPYIGINGKQNRVLVTSSIAKEGKSFVALNLASSVAATGKRVVLVEFDLINPTLGKKLELEFESGLTDYLLNKKEVADICMPVEQVENLSLVPAGQPLESSSDLLTQHKLDQLFNYLSSNYDLVIVDSAPIGLISDAFAISEYCDATIFVVRQDTSPKSMIKKLKKESTLARLKNTSVVYNGTKTRNSYLKEYYSAQ